MWHRIIVIGSIASSALLLGGCEIQTDDMWSSDGYHNYVSHTVVESYDTRPHRGHWHHHWRRGWERAPQPQRPADHDHYGPPPAPPASANQGHYGPAKQPSNQGHYGPAPAKPSNGGHYGPAASNSSSSQGHYGPPQVAHKQESSGAFGPVTHSLR